MRANAFDAKLLACIFAGARFTVFGGACGRLVLLVVWLVAHHACAVSLPLATGSCGVASVHRRGLQRASTWR